VYLIYQPEGSEDPQRWWYDPNRLMAPEREKIEELTGLDFGDFTKKVIGKNSKCRRALLFVFLKRSHPTLKFGDVDFSWQELRMEFSKEELAAGWEKVKDDLSAAELVEQQAGFDQAYAEAPEAPEGVGKVGPPVVD
jgi:hypothetical protein